MCGVQHGDGEWALQLRQATTIMQKKWEYGGEKKGEQWRVYVACLSWFEFAIYERVCILLAIPWRHFGWFPAGRLWSSHRASGASSRRSREKKKRKAREWHATCGVWIINYIFSMFIVAFCGRPAEWVSALLHIQKLNLLAVYCMFVIRKSKIN